VLSLVSVKGEKSCYLRMILPNYYNFRVDYLIGTVYLMELMGIPSNNEVKLPSNLGDRHNKKLTGFESCL